MTTHPIPARALEQHSAIVGRTGSGKSYAARGAVEQILDAGGRCCIIDPTGSWWGLRSSADGQSPGYPVVVFGGDHGDVPLTEKMGEQLGELLAGADLSAVIDLTGFGVGEARRFMAAFAGALYHYLRSPLHLIIDEADEFAPQRIGPDQTTMFNRIDRIVRRGRNRGFRVMMISQRPAVLNKDVLSQAAMLIAMKLTAPHDRSALSAWIDGQADRSEGKRVIDSLPRLKVGEGWVWWPDGELLDQMKFPRIKTFDSSRTPGVGESIAEPAKLAQVDLAEIREKLAMVDEKPERRPEAVHSQATVTKVALAEAQHDGHRRGAEDERARLLAWLKPQDEGAIERLTRAIESLGELRALISDRLAGVPAIATAAAPALHKTAPSSQPEAPSVHKSVVPLHKPQGGPQERVIAGLAEMAAIGLQEPARILVANLAGYGHLNSTGFVKAMGALRTAGLVDYPGAGSVTLTDAGRAAAPWIARPLTNADLHARVMAFQSGPGRSILQSLISAYPNAMTREAVAKAAGYEHLNSTGFVKAIGRLRTMGFIDYPSGGMVKAEPILFIGGSA